ncbi:polymer-forming cytoskeletal protein [Daejeonella sp.]|uniref:bactofilin family protein n=1 Tax=Daejeonella sp. TaxID=2805397 RepID=UPI0025BB4525|nr:polymer-forming cytoskeletal protein [Daejeonella sp.]
MAIDFIKNMFGKKDKKKEAVADFHTTIIKVDDNFISSSSIMLDEKLFGNIFSLKEVDIAAPSEISGNIISRTSVISGKVFGDIRATEYVEVKSTATITGNILAKSIMIEPGAIINGSIRIDGAIDERDLIEKVENRLKLNMQVGSAATPFLIEEKTSQNSKKK